MVATVYYFRFSPCSCAVFVSRDRVCVVLICEQLMEMIVSGRKEIAKFLDLVKVENCSVV